MRSIELRRSWRNCSGPSPLVDETVSQAGRRVRLCASERGCRYAAASRNRGRTSTENRGAALAGDTEIIEPARWRCRASPRLGRSASPRAIFGVVVDLGVRRERLELVHDDGAAARGAAKVLAAQQTHGWHADVRWSERRKVRWAAGQRAFFRIAGGHGADQPADDTPAHETAQVRLDPVPAPGHRHVNTYVQRGGFGSIDHNDR